MIKNFDNYINEGSEKDVTMFNSFKTKYRLGQHRKIIYYLNGQKRYEIWYLGGGMNHREDGPAIQIWYLNGNINHSEWWLDNIKYTREDWVNKLKEIKSPFYKEQKMLLNIEKYNL